MTGPAWFPIYNACGINSLQRNYVIPLTAVVGSETRNLLENAQDDAFQVGIKKNNVQDMLISQSRPTVG